MNNRQPIIKLDDLTINPVYTDLKARIDENPEAYRPLYNAIKNHLTACIKNTGYTKSEAGKIAHNYMNSHMEHPYIEQRTGGGLYEVFYMRMQMNEGFYKALPADFWKYYTK